MVFGAGLEGIDGSGLNPFVVSEFSIGMIRSRLFSTITKASTCAVSIHKISSTSDSGCYSTTTVPTRELDPRSETVMRVKLTKSNLSGHGLRT
jgi:hypothetical protein